jgi:uncharacterized membrane protein
MATKQLILAIYESEAAAKAAAEQLKIWDTEQPLITLKSVGVLALDSNGKLKAEEVGRRSTGKGAGIGMVLAMATPIGLAAGLVGGAVLGALHHKGLGLSNEDRERLGKELADGKAAVGVLIDPLQAPAVTSMLAGLGGTLETHDVDDAALAEVDAAAEATPTG